MSTSIENITHELNTGVFDKLMESVNKHVENQYLENRITNTDYANVYLGSLQSVLAQSVQYELQRDITNAQIEGIIADNELKTKQLEMLTVELAIKQYQLDNILPKELEKITKDIDVAERSMIEQEATGAKQRILLDTEEQIKQYEFDFLLPEQLTKIQEEIDLLQTQDSETILDGAKKRLIMDEEIESANLQQIILQTEEELKTAQVAEAIDNTARANIQLDDSLLTTVKQRILLDEEAESANKQQLLADAQIKTAYTDRVLKDKQAAKLGLDNVMKQSETSRISDDTFIYTPNYEEI